MANFKAGKKPFKFKPWLGLRRIAPFQTEHNADGEKIRIFWLRLAAWIVSLVVIGWLGVTGVAFLFIKYQREFSTVQYEHLFLYPWKKDDYRQARCRFLLEKGKAQLADKKYLEAFNNIRLGLLEVPEDTDARINIVQFYIALKRYDLAERTLAEGLEFNIDEHDYVMTYFRFLFGQQRDDRAIEISRQIQASNPKNSSVRHTLIMAEASAHYFRGRYTKAMATIKGEIAAGASDAILLSAQIKWQLGEKDKALSILSDLSRRDLKELAEIYRIRVEYFKQLGRLSDVRRLAVLRQVEHPEDPIGFLDEITTCDPATETVRLAGAIAEFFNRFPDSAPAMNGLAEIAASTGQVDLAWRVYRQCKAKDLAWLPSATAVIESNLVAKRFADALTAIQTVVTDNEEWAKANGTQFDAFRSIANYGLGDKSLSELQLQNFLNDKQANPASFYPVAVQMARVGALDQARTILAAAVKANPLDQASLTRLVELDLEQLDTQSLVINTDRLLVMRKPEPDFLRKIQSTLQSDRYIFEGSDALLQKISARLAQKEEG
jgi:Tfp pilus assembly protein PilF